MSKLSSKLPEDVARIGSAATEAQAKSAYLRAFDLDRRGVLEYDQVDYASPDLWIEFKLEGKFGESAHRAQAVGQMLHYLHNARKQITPKATSLPGYFAIADRESTIIFQTSDFRELIEDAQYYQNFAPSAPKPALESALLSQDAFRFAKTYTHKIDHFALHADIENIPTRADIPRIERVIDSFNFLDAFAVWKHYIGNDIDADYRRSFQQPCPIERVFVNDIRDELKLIADGVLQIEPGKVVKVDAKQYAHFWRTHYRPITEQVAVDINAKLDRLKSNEFRERHGVFYTPLLYAKEAIDHMVRALDMASPNELDSLYIWDMCAGTGNLEWHLPANCYSNMFLSTFDSTEIELLQDRNTFPGATLFQYDYLNDDIELLLNNDLFGNDLPERLLNDGLNWKLPRKLREVLARVQRGEAKMLVFINPPFAESTTAQGGNKGGTTTTNLKTHMKKQGYGGASNELFLQFLHRIAIEMPGAWLGLFAKLKYLQSVRCEDWRKQFRARFHGGFLMHCKLFSDISARWPVAFAVWKLDEQAPAIGAQRLQFNILQNNPSQVIPIGEKELRVLDKDAMLNSSKWIDRKLARGTPTEAALPLSTYKTVGESRRVTMKSRENIGYLLSVSNDIQNAIKDTALFSAVAGKGSGIHVTPDNIERILITLAVRIIGSHAACWTADRDQFSIPQLPLPEDFVTDCLIWCLAANSNQTSALHGFEHEGDTYTVSNAFFPFDPASINARWQQLGLVPPPRTGAITPLAALLQERARSPEAERLHKALHELYCFTIPKLDQLSAKFCATEHLTSWDLGYKQVIAAYDELHAHTPQDATLKPKVRDARKLLGQKILPQIFSLGFLPEEGLFH